mmetsp:Transcript_25924/g.64421  ORF Transcript_25924/g.64421 Transcript_25924/m.64421 type:complete len:136 (-) Transcript_25924:669-1076(-)
MVGWLAACFCQGRAWRHPYKRCRSLVTPFFGLTGRQSVCIFGACTSISSRQTGREALHGIHPSHKPSKPTHTHTHMHQHQRERERERAGHQPNQHRRVGDVLHATRNLLSVRRETESIDVSGVHVYVCVWMRMAD